MIEMKRTLLPTIVILLFSVTPLVAHAQAPANFIELVNMIIGIINPLITLILGGIVLVFLFGLAKFLFSLGDAKSVEEGKQLMFWGVVGLFVAFSFWGLVALLTNTFLNA
jgi:fumarate reductase subunit D